MSIKKYFKSLPSSSVEQIGRDVESYRYVRAKEQDIQRYVPPVDFTTASNFVKYGSAERYYVDTIQRIYNQYPYDGALSEKQVYENSSSYLDQYFFDYLYPRTNGHALLSADGWGTKSGNITVGYGLSATKEYIEIIGGPHTASGGMIGKKLLKTFDNSNIYDTTKKRYSNLHLDPSQGNAVEFWLKKDDWGLTKTWKEVVFDLWNYENSSSTSYGRLRVELSGTDVADTATFRITAYSGTAGAYDVPIGAAVTTASLTSWHHYAFTVNNDGSSLQFQMYKDGGLIDTVTTGSSMSSIVDVSSSVNARIGALMTSPSGTTLATPEAGWGKLSASIDEFRFWKSDRTSAQIGKNWWTQTYGGTNTDDANTDLGVYYKFNEGITETSSTDSIVLDYSGRISNGSWVGYLGTQSRNTDSAMVLASASAAEFKDPIVYSFHPDVKSLESAYKDSGSYFDYSNNSAIINSIPQWIIDDETKNGSGQLGRLVQIISTYFDTLHSQISQVPKLANINYSSASYKPLPFASELLESHGLITSEIFADSTVLEQLLSRNDDFNFAEELPNIKNTIYQNIYNNLVNIYKKKGTEDSFRNLFRCFGVDDELLKLRIYANNAEYEFRNNYRNTYTKKRVIDLNHANRFSSVIYQYPETGNSNSTGFISGSETQNLERNLAVTIEADIYFPKKPDPSETGYVYTSFITSSLFGTHQANSSDNTDLSWQTVDSGSIQVFAIRDKVESENVAFSFSSSTDTFNTSSTSVTFKDVYNNTKWTLALRIKPTSYPVQGITSYTNDDNYSIELYGVSLYGDLVQNEFTISATASQDNSQKFLQAAKRVFAGAHRENITGTVQQESDIRISAVRYWMSHLSDDEVKSHARDPLNYGVDYPSENTFLINSNITSSYIPKISTLALNWDFSQVTGSDASGQFTIADISSGSTDISSRYGWISNIINLQNTGRGDKFEASNTGVVKSEYFFTNRQEPPDVGISSDLITIVDDSEEYFVRDSRPISHHFAVEKSMNATISEEILKFFSGIVDFNRLIGNPVNRYRGEYKEFRLLREIFFEKIQNIPDLDKYMEYYKWIDSSLNGLIEQLIPAATSFSDGVQNVIESHVLERSKYRHKFPTLEMSFDDPESPMLGINELLYNWKFNHHPIPISGVEQTGSSCQWWKQRVDRADSGASSGDATVDAQRDELQDVLNTHRSQSAPTLAQSNLTTYKGSTFVLTTLSKPQRFTVLRQKIIKGGVNFEDSKKMDFHLNATYPHGPMSTIGVPLNVLTVALDGDSTSAVGKTTPEQDCKDILIPNLKNKLETKVVIGRNFDGLEDYSDSIKGSIVLPFSIFSSSVRTGYTKRFWDGFVTGANPVNLHIDTYAPDHEVPMQGPFTEKYVGGRQSRHVDLNRRDTSLTTEGGGATINNLDDQYSRPEAWRIVMGGGPISAGAFGIIGADYGGPYPDPNRLRATRYRDEYAKRPLNIRNIQQTTGSGAPGITVIGNYTNMYEVINVGGRYINSIEFIHSGGTSLPSLFDTHNRDLAPTTNLNTLVAVATGPQGNFFGRKNKNVSQLSNTTPTTISQRIPNFSSSNVVFANKFSAPGGPEIQSLGYLDLKSQEKSVYNALPFRNLSVRSSGSGEVTTMRVNSHIGTREGLESMLSRHCGQFGSDSRYGSITAATYPTNPSFHKINRNVSRRYETSGSSTIFTVSYDNANVQHMIPRSDLQYSWVTASLGTSSLNPAEYAPVGAAWTGYIPRSGLVISASEAGSTTSSYASAINWPESDIAATV